MLRQSLSDQIKLKTEEAAKLTSRFDQDATNSVVRKGRPLKEVHCEVEGLQAAGARSPLSTLLGYAAGFLPPVKVPVLRKASNRRHLTFDTDAWLWASAPL